MRSLVRAMVIATCALAAAPGLAPAATRTAKVARVVDGDTIRVAIAGRSVEVDLLGVRAVDGCGIDGAATLRALLPRGARVRLARDGYSGGAYVMRRSTFVNAELLAMGAARTAGLRGLRRAARLRAAQRQARTLRLGLWSCDHAPVTSVTDAPAGVDTPQNRADLDRFVRGHRFTAREDMDGQKFEIVIHFCDDGRLVAQYSMGLDRGSTKGTWKLLDVVRRDGSLFFGRVEVTFPDDEGESETDSMGIGHRGDGTAVMGDEEDQTTVTRARADAC